MSGVVIDGRRVAVPNLHVIEGQAVRHRRRHTGWIRQIILHGDDCAAHLAIDRDGTVTCRADLARAVAYHTAVCDEWSIGIALRGETTAAYDSAVTLVKTLCRAFSIQFQIPSCRTRLARLVDGGVHVVGVFGHDATHDREVRGVSDALFERLAAAGAERFDFDAGEELAAWRARQISLVRAGAELITDGVAGPATTHALRKHGVLSGVWALGRRLR